MYEMNVRSMIIDQFRPRSVTSTIETNITPAKPILCLWIGVPGFMFFLNFIDNIGISLTRSNDRMIDAIGIKNSPVIQLYNTLDVSLLT